jgi:hypothetical protein
MTKQPEGASPALIHDHPYLPRDPERADWDLCLRCNLGAAAHARRATPEEEDAMRVPFTIEKFGTAFSWGDGEALPGTVPLSRWNAEQVFGRGAADLINPPGLLMRVWRRIAWR